MSAVQLPPASVSGREAEETVAHHESNNASAQAIAVQPPDAAPHVTAEVARILLGILSGTQGMRTTVSSDRARCM